MNSYHKDSLFDQFWLLLFFSSVSIPRLMFFFYSLEFIYNELWCYIDQCDRMSSMHSILFYFTLLYSTLLYSTLLYSILLYSTLFYSILLSSILFYSILFYSILFLQCIRLAPATVSIMSLSRLHNKIFIKCQAEMPFESSPAQWQKRHGESRNSTRNRYAVTIPWFPRVASL